MTQNLRSTQYQVMSKKTSGTLLNDLVKKLKVDFAKQIKLGSSLLKSIQSGQLSSFELSSEGQLWISRAMLAHWLKRWNMLYENILSVTNSFCTLPIKIRRGLISASYNVCFMV